MCFKAFNNSLELQSRNYSRLAHTLEVCGIGNFSVRGCQDRTQGPRAASREDSRLPCAGALSPRPRHSLMRISVLGTRPPPAFVPGSLTRHRLGPSMAVFPAAVRPGAPRGRGGPPLALPSILAD